MTKDEMIAQIAGKVEGGITKKLAGQVFDATMDVIASTLLAGNDVALPGIGVLKVKQRVARVGVNPLTKAKLEIPAKKAVAFNAAKFIKDGLNPTPKAKAKAKK